MPSADVQVATCVVGRIRSLPLLAAHLQQQVVSAVGGDAHDTFLSIELNGGCTTAERRGLRSAIDVLRPKHATLFCDAAPSARTEWAELPSTSLTVLPTKEAMAHLDPAVRRTGGKRCGIELGNFGSFYGNQHKANFCFRSVVAEERRHGRPYDLLVNVRADLFLSKPLPPAAAIPREHVIVPFCATRSIAVW